MGCSGDHLEALPRALCLASQISSMDEIWPRGAGSTHNEPHAAAQRCQPTPAVGLGCLGTGGSLRRPPRSLATCARPREINLVHGRSLALAASTACGQYWATPNPCPSFGRCPAVAMARACNRRVAEVPVSHGDGVHSAGGEHRQRIGTAAETPSDNPDTACVKRGIAWLARANRGGRMRTAADDCGQDVNPSRKSVQDGDRVTGA